MTAAIDEEQEGEMDIAIAHNDAITVTLHSIPPRHPIAACAEERAIGGAGCYRPGAGGNLIFRGVNFTA